MAAGYYRILLGNEWDLVDLYEFPHAYTQNYAFIYCLDADHTPANAQRINRALRDYPWGGGYSYVNIYTVMNNQIALEDRPQIKSIQKSSPGWLDLILHVDVAIDIAKSVAALSAAAASAAVAYKSIYKSVSDISVERKKRELQKLKIAESQARSLNQMSKELAKFLGFKKVQELEGRTNDPEVTVKLLMAHYRRIEKLAEYVDSGKAELPPVVIQSPDPGRRVR